MTWLDAARGLAVVGMLETHSATTFLGPQWEVGKFYGWWVYFEGLVAPAFLFIAGYGQGLGLNRRVTGGGAVYRKTAVRLLGILLLAYAMRGFTPVVDVLHCLAVSLLAVLGVEWLATRGLAEKSDASGGAGAVPWAAVAAQALFTVAVVLVAPHSKDWPAVFRPVDAYFDVSGDSLFPLLPWAAFVSLGWLAARMKSWPWWLVAVAAALSFVPSPYPFTKEAPEFFLSRIGWLFMLLALVAAVFRRWPAPGWLTLLGRESLLVYVLHTAVLHLFDVYRWIPRTQGPGFIAVSFFALLLICIAAAHANERRKQCGFTVAAWRSGKNSRADAKKAGS